MKARMNLLLAGAAAAATLAALGSRGEPRVSLHPLDLRRDDTPVAPRVWHGPGHVAFHLREFLALAFPLSAVYVLHAISPAFRERIMLVTALANGCAW